MSHGLMAVLGMFVLMGMGGLTLGADKDESSAVVKGNNAFGLAMYGKLSEKEQGNVFFSPASIESALAMTCAGASGETAKQMAATLHIDTAGDKAHDAFKTWIDRLNHPPEIQEYRAGASGKFEQAKVPAYQLVVANALWGQKGYPFKAEFTGLVAKNYGGAMNEVDFAQEPVARAAINGWIEKQTRDRIKDMIPQGVLVPATRLVLTNAIYFKSDWAEQFQQASTSDESFTTSAGKAESVPMMHQQKHFAYTETDSLQALELPYKGYALAMVILLPKKVDGLAQLEKELTAEKVDRILDQMNGEMVSVSLPRWKFTTGLLNLNDALKSMGMKNAFDPAKADFSGMVTHEPLFISDVMHKAFVAVDEEGTEAAAATAVVMRAGAAMAPEKPKVFKADHPFVFLIRHNPSGGILFMGRLANPRE